MFLFLEAHNTISKISLKTKAVDSNFFLLTRQTTTPLNTHLHALNKSSRIENTISIVNIMRYSHRKSSELRTRPLRDHELCSRICRRVSCIAIDFEAPYTSACGE